MMEPQITNTQQKTINKVRESITNTFIVNDAHQLRVAKLLGGTLYNEAENRRRVLQGQAAAQKEGFYYFVGKNIFHQFKYAAGVGRPIRAKPKGLIIGIIGIIAFAVSGVLFAFLIDTAFLLLALPAPLLVLFPFVESTTRYVGDIPDFALDRVEILQRAWYVGMPLTVHSNDPLPVKKERLFVRVDPVLVAWIDDSYSMGVVIAVWDNDKELEI